MNRIDLKKDEIEAVTAFAISAPAVPEPVRIAIAKLIEFYGRYGFDGYGEFVKAMDANLRVVAERMHELAEMDWEKVSRQGSPSHEKYQTLLEISREGVRMSEAMAKLGRSKLGGVLDEVKAVIRAEQARAGAKADAKPEAAAETETEPAEDLDQRSVVDVFADRNRTE